jgi:UDP-N-acetylmuramoyl-tripeptide--D-alanyl-D-alanine ligase
MIELTAAQVALATGGRLAGADPAARVTGPVVIDSRQVVPGALFVAIVGEHVDGHDFAAGAARAGAALVLAAREVAGVPSVVVDDVQAALGRLATSVLATLREANDVRVAAVTGSVGKTTTKDLLGRLVEPLGPTVVPRGSFNNELGLPLTVLTADASTRFLVLEMGADHEGNLTYLTSIAPPDVAVVLVVGTAHLAHFGDVETIARTKSELVQGLRPGGVAVLNADDLRVAAMASLVEAPSGPVASVVRFGTVSSADVRASDVRVDTDGHASFVLHTPGGGAFPVALRLVGEHHVTNALAAAAAALQLGVAPEDVAERLATTGPLSPHRMHVVDRPDGVRIIDDSYNANPDSMRAGLRALAVMAATQRRRSVAVLGEMLELGPDSRAVHDELGELVVRLNIRWTVVVGAGAGGIVDGARREGSWGEEVVHVADLDEAAAVLRDGLQDGDIVLVKSSKGAGLWRLANELTGLEVPA